MDIHETAFCASCGEATVHFRLAQGRLECQEPGCGEIRDAGPNQLWDPAAVSPVCPDCNGVGGTPARDGPPWVDCATCYSTGWVRLVDLPLGDAS